MSADCVPNIMSLGIPFKNWTSLNLACLLELIVSKFALFSVSRLKDEKLIKANLHEKWNKQTLF